MRRLGQWVNCSKFLFWHRNGLNHVLVMSLVLSLKILKIFQRYASIGQTRDIYLLSVNYGNTRTMFEVCSKLIIKAAEQLHWRRFGVFIVNFEQISNIVLVFSSFTLNKQMPAGICLITLMSWKQTFHIHEYSNDCKHDIS